MTVIEEVREPTTRFGGARSPRPRTWLNLVLVVAVAGLLIAYPHMVTKVSSQNIGITALVFAIAATGWNLLGGYTGQVSFGHALFFGAGMYTTAVMVRVGWSPWLALVPSIVIAGFLGWLVGLPCFRLRGHYFSIATIAVGQIVLTVVNLTTWLGDTRGRETRGKGSQGIILPFRDQSLNNVSFNLRDKTDYYYMALVLFAVVTAAAALFVRGKAGRYVRAIRDDDRAASAVGVPVRRYKLVAVTLSAGITAIAGWYQLLQLNFVDPSSSLDLTISIQIALIAVLGGVGSLWGPLIGAWIVIFIQEYSRIHWSSAGHPVDLLIYGGMIVVIAVAEPTGLVGLIKRISRFGTRRWRAATANRSAAVGGGQ